MIIPSIDIMNNSTVQLVGGEKQALDAGDPRPIARRFGQVGEIAVVDLDAALGRGDNVELIESLLPIADCRVGGGIRDVDTALRWLDRGATKVVLGTAAKPDLLRQLPKERVIAALDARSGEVVVEGWRTRTGVDVADAIGELVPYVSGFLITIVEREGRLTGVDLDHAARLRERCGPARLTLAGGVSTAEEVAALDGLGIDAQVGMAIYTDKFSLADSLAAMLRSDRPDGLWPTVVVDELGVALGLAYSSRESLAETLKTGRAVYQSRSRGLWRKGETSGAIQTLVRVDTDCDRDTLLFVVRQHGAGFCHLDTRTCFGSRDRGLGALMRRIEARNQSAPAGSYTRRLFDDPELLRAKLLEEAGELADAETTQEVVHEAADVIYFACVRAASRGVDLAAIEAELDARALKVRRRGGDAKPGARS
ncbi:MAG: phosphoribosyl-ATP diphosphatase [Myxococcales bacterium FL481]|nr:MAG: phosphoribosyl-ATP diphosphatase [Myxococcales bacterium FL481]